MTCIIGLVHNGRVYMGGDSIATDGWDMEHAAHSKVFRAHDLLIGYTDSFRMGQLLQFELQPPPQPDKQCDLEYMVTGLTETIRELFKRKGYLRLEDSRELGGLFLVGYRGQLYKIQRDFSVMQYRESFTAIGAGEAYALSAMWVLKQLPPKKRILKALKAAVRFSNGVANPFTIEVLKK